MYVWIIVLFGVAVFGTGTLSGELSRDDAAAGVAGYLLGAGMGWSCGKSAEREAHEDGGAGDRSQT